PGEADAAGERGGEVVRVPLEVEPGREQLVRARLPASGERAGDEAERDGGRARAEAALARDPVDEAKREALRRRDPGERAHAQVLLVDGAIALGHLELVPQLEGDRGDVEAGAEVRARGGRADVDPHAPRPSRDASVTVSDTGGVPTGHGPSGRGAALPHGCAACGSLGRCASVTLSYACLTPGQVPKGQMRAS